MAEKLKLAQPGDGMTERNICVLASKGKEVIIIDTSDEEWRGFFSGLDDEYIQLCLSENAALVLINRSYVVSIEETKYHLKDFGDDILRQDIEDRVGNFINVAEKRLSDR